MKRLEKLIDELGMDIELKPFLDSRNRRVIEENAIFSLLSSKADRRINLRHDGYGYPGKGALYTIQLTPRNLEIFFRFYGIRYKEESANDISKTFNISSARVNKISQNIKQYLTRLPKTKIWYTFLDSL